MQIPPNGYDDRRASGNLESLRGRNDPEAIKAVAREMEALFAYELLKVMRETTGSSKEGAGGLGSDTYMSMFDMELSRVLADRGLGLQESLTKGLSAIAEKAGNTAAKEALPQSGSHQQKPAEPAAAPAGIEGVLPDAKSLRVSSQYGPRTDPFSGEPAFHHGVDIAAPEGTDIHAARAGTVVFSGFRTGYGNMVIIDHGDGYMTKYAHSCTNLVSEGDKVDAGSVIAQVGSTGRSTGPHVHFEVLYQGRKVNPDALLSAG